MKDVPVYSEYRFLPEGNSIRELDVSKGRISGRKIEDLISFGEQLMKKGVKDSVICGISHKWPLTTVSAILDTNFNVRSWFTGKVDSSNALNK